MVLKSLFLIVILDLITKFAILKKLAYIISGLVFYYLKVDRQNKIIYNKDKVRK